MYTRLSWNCLPHGRPHLCSSLVGYKLRLDTIQSGADLGCDGSLASFAGCRTLSLILRAKSEIWRSTMATTLLRKPCLHQRTHHMTHLLWVYQNSLHPHSPASLQLLSRLARSHIFRSRKRPPMMAMPTGLPPTNLEDSLRTIWEYLLSPKYTR